MRDRLRGFVARRIRSNDEGAVVVLVALLTVVFMGCAALAVDIGRAQVTAFQLQKAADAGSLAGDVFLPDDFGKASSVATATALANVRVSGSAPPTVTTAIGDRPTQLKVTVTMPISYFFGAAIGLGATTISRTSVADYAGPTPMGSPCNVFGREDMPGTGDQAPTNSSNCAGAGTYWVNIAGSNVNMARGDAFAAGWCTKPDDGKGIDDCSIPNSSASNPGVNKNFATVGTKGYVYVVRVKQPGQLTLQGYDIAWTATGDTCGENMIGAAGVTNPLVTDTNDSKNRYAATGNQYCPGDTQMSYPEGDLSKVRTIVTVRGPSATSFDPLDGPILCTRTWNGWGREFDKPDSYNVSPAPTQTKPLPLKDLLTGTSPSYDASLAEVFHRWAPLCTGGALNVGASDYSVQVQSLGGGGQNRYALRAKITSGADNVSIFANGRTSLFNNVPAGTSSFYLVRLGSGTNNHNLTLRFFDLGDSAQPVTATVLQPDNTTLTPDVPWTGCSGAGPIAGPLTNCSIVATASVNGGRWQSITVPIPKSYRCNADADQAKCWVKIKLSTTAGQSDTTTWQAALDGDPVRIIR